MLFYTYNITILIIFQKRCTIYDFFIAKYEANQTLFSHFMLISSRNFWVMVIFIRREYTFAILNSMQ